MSISFDVNVPCPYCGKKNRHFIEMHSKEKANFFGCCYEEGGCNREFAYSIKLKITGVEWKLERPTVEGDAHE